MVIMNYNPLVLWSFPGTGTIERPGLEGGEEVEICGKETWAKKFIYLGKISAQFQGHDKLTVPVLGAGVVSLGWRENHRGSIFITMVIQHPLKKLQMVFLLYILWLSYSPFLQRVIGRGKRFSGKHKWVLLPLNCDFPEIKIIGLMRSIPIPNLLLFA